MNKYKVKIPFFALAPMANITTYPFASQAVKYGADLVWTSMVHTDTIINNWPEAEKILNFREISNFLVQIVGSDPEKFTKSIKIIEKHLNPLGFDLNMACPDKNIIKSGCGGALMKNPELMMQIAAAAVKCTKKPVSVKTRLGWEREDEIIKLLPMFEKSGISMLTVHGRTVKQAFGGNANWEKLSKIKTKTRKMLICGSGDITSWEQAVKLQKSLKLMG